MNFELFIANRIAVKGSKLIINIAIAAIGLSMGVMIIASAIVTGFQKEISSKVTGFGSHIQITSFNNNNSFESSPIVLSREISRQLLQNPVIKYLQPFATKAGILKTKSDMEGVLLKGVDKNFDWSFFKKNMVSGSLLHFQDNEKSNELLISLKVANKLKLNIDDKINMYFVQEPPRVRSFKISGIYDTGLEDFDKLYVLGDIAHIQKLNNWQENQVGGYEIFLNDFESLEKTTELVNASIGYELQAKDIKKLYPQIFDWLKLQDTNVYILIILMVLISIINMITALIVLILERTNMIGVLKSLGATDWSIRKIFIFNAVHLTGLGLLWGNVIGIGLCMFQLTTGFFTLSQESYYVSMIPINLELKYLLLLNLGTIIICSIMMIIPTKIISKIYPVKAIRFG